MRVDVLGVGFDSFTMDQAVAEAMRLLATEGCHYVVTPNPELVDRARREEPFRQALNGADLVLPDGIGVVYAAKLLGRPLKGRCPGIDFAGKLMERMAKTGLRLYLLGAKPGVAETAAARLEAKYPGLIICGTHDGYFKEDAPVVEAVRAAEADVVFVCLGAPKQEVWMAQHGPATGAHLMVGLGGVLDVYAGHVKRAPAAWQKLGLEWCYRLLHQPSRIGRMAKLPGFLVAAAGEKRKRGKP